MLLYISSLGQTCYRSVERQHRAYEVQERTFNALDRMVRNEECGVTSRNIHVLCRFKRLRYEPRQIVVHNPVARRGKTLKTATRMHGVLASQSGPVTFASARGRNPRREGTVSKCCSICMC